MPLEHRATIEAYFADFIQALTAYLRPEAAHLGPEWLGLAQHRRTMLIDWADTGFSARVIDSWLNKPIIGKLRPDGGRRVTGYFAGPRPLPDTHFLFATVMRNYRGDAKTDLSVSHDDELVVTLEGTDAAFGILAPSQYVGLTEDEALALGKAHSPKDLLPFASRLSKPPWTVAFISTGPGHRLLDGFDPDPILLARSIADAILYSSGLRDVPPTIRYREAAAGLRHAVTSLSPHNEATLQVFLESHPWVLVPEADFDTVLARPSFAITEELPNGTREDHRLIPDFVYHLFDHQSLVVEIEAATKRLFTTKEATTLQLVAAATTAATFQINAYKLYFSGALGAQIRRQLGKPDSWGFDYLLVVGSELQTDFDQRSWAALRDQLKTGGVTLRTWDYYLDRLTRLAAMADFKSGLPGAV